MVNRSNMVNGRATLSPIGPARAALVAALLAVLGAGPVGAAGLAPDATGFTVDAAPVAAGAAFPVAAGSLINPAQAAGQFLKALNREANWRLSGAVQETLLYPPRPDPARTLSELPPPPRINLALLKANYDVSVSAGEPIAGRATWRMLFAPRNLNAPRYTVWLDRVWGLRLGYEEQDALGLATNHAEFTQLDGPPVRRDPPQKYAQAPYSPQLEANVFGAVGALDLPPGFHVSSVTRRKVANETSLQVTATNGLAPLVLVFTTVRQTGAPKAAARQAGRAYALAVGNLPDADLQRAIARLNALDVPGLVKALTTKAAQK